MKKMMILAVLLLAINPAGAAESKAAGKSYFENLLRGLKTRIQQKLESKTRVSAVAAVRGAKQGGDAYALYWKGGVSDKAQKKLGEEKKKLADAVQLIVDGDAEGGRSAIEKFLKDNPDSVYAPDAKEALANLPQEEALEEEKAKPAPASRKSAAPAPAEDEDE